jgi:hypothetical protein
MKGGGKNGKLTDTIRAIKNYVIKRQDLLLLLLFVMCHSFGSGMNKRGETKFMI